MGNICSLIWIWSEIQSINRYGSYIVASHVGVIRISRGKFHPLLVMVLQHRTNLFTQPIKFIFQIQDRNTYNHLLEITGDQCKHYKIWRHLFNIVQSYNIYSTMPTTFKLTLKIQHVIPNCFKNLLNNYYDAKFKIRMQGWGILLVKKSFKITLFKHKWLRTSAFTIIPLNLKNIFGYNAGTITTN